MARPPAEELTDRELEVMRAVWNPGAGDPAEPTAAEPTAAEPTVGQLRDRLAAAGRELAPTTVATLVSILQGKGFLVRVGDRRPYRYRAARGFEEVSRNLVGELVRKVFGGSREALLARLFDADLTPAERRLLEDVLNGDGPRTASAEGAGDE